MGAQGRKRNFVKIFFLLCMGTQERKRNLIKRFFHLCERRKISPAFLCIRESEILIS